MGLLDSDDREQLAKQKHGQVVKFPFRGRCSRALG